MISYENNRKIPIRWLMAAGFFLVFFSGLWMFAEEVGWLHKPGTPYACTMEAKQCPDGSYVGRSGPNCEFATCPNIRTSDVQKFDVSTWKTYRNEKYGFEVKYPRDLEVRINDATQYKDSLFSFSIYDKNYKAPLDAVGQQVRDELRNIDFYIYPLALKKSIIQSDLSSVGDAGYDKYAVTVAGFDTEAYILHTIGGLYFEAFFSSKDVLFVIGSFQAELARQILSTFKFLK